MHVSAPQMQTSRRRHTHRESRLRVPKRWRPALADCCTTTPFLPRAAAPRAKWQTAAPGLLCFVASLVFAGNATKGVAGSYAGPRQKGQSPGATGALGDLGAVGALCARHAITDSVRPGAALAGFGWPGLEPKTSHGLASVRGATPCRCARGCGVAAGSDPCRWYAS